MVARAPTGGDALVFRIAQNVALTLFVSMVRVKNPRYDPSLHCRSAFRVLETRVREMLSAAAGRMWFPKDEPEVTAEHKP